MVEVVTPLYSRGWRLLRILPGETNYFQDDLDGLGWVRNISLPFITIAWELEASFSSSLESVALISAISLLIISLSFFALEEPQLSLSKNLNTFYYLQ